VEYRFLLAAYNLPSMVTPQSTRNESEGGYPQSAGPVEGFYPDRDTKPDIDRVPGNRSLSLKVAFAGFLKEKKRLNEKN